jgi:hypothetical protein
MGVPQQPELRRSRRSPVDPRSVKEQRLDERPDEHGRSAPVPEDNVEGHHPEREQDKPVELGGAGHGTGGSSSS